ncbi:glycoside hydrolase family 43 protein [Catenovulum agarivorans]|uniref:glycoside hydrolase family 43 protein n=1 Tax=Catenovulum agarivorans TaxID=1172192 RepID=UPI001ED8CFFC|nr:glycoside hydrolase family 43 protein [Catenovulum agarivorans]
MCGLISCQAIKSDKAQSKAAPLVSQIYTADPSAHVFDNKLYIYPSHDVDSGIASDSDGVHFAMRDYHVISLDSVDQPATLHPKALDVDDVAWASRQMWAPDAAEKDGLYYLYFPAKDKNDIFRIGVAVADNPTGPFKAQPHPIAGTYSIDPAVYNDNGEYYLYVGGIWGGQLQHWHYGKFQSQAKYPADNEPALMPKVAKLADNMLSLAEPLKDLILLDQNGKAITQGDNDKRFFEAAWMHKYQGRYYFSWSTGDTHKIVYAIGDSPYGPFVFQGTVLEPVVGWTNHHSIAEFKGKWYLFFHDSAASNGATHLRSVKMLELTYDSEGKIIPINAYK